MDALIERTTHEMGKVDIMVANSGGGGSPKLEDITLEDWENQMRLNLSTSHTMIAQGTGGRIINISSTAGINLNPGLPAYADAKAGMISCTKSLALSWAGEGINVNCVAPGFTATEGITINAGGINEPEHVANVAVFLAAPASSHVTSGTMFHMARVAVRNTIEQIRVELIRHLIKS